MLIRHVALVAIFATSAPTVQAQETELNSAAERTAACLEIEDATERLACFETAAQGLSDALEAGQIREETPAQPVQPEAAAAAPAPEAPAAPVQSADAPAQGQGTGSQKDAALPEWAEAPEPEPEPQPEPAATPGADSEADSLPLWARVFNRDNEEDKADEISISVVRILRNNAGRHFFITADGQEWEQTFAETVRPPRSLPAQATIKEALFGSPRLSFDNGPSGAYTVRRTK